LTDEEFAETYLTMKLTEEDENVERVTLRSENPANAIDWTDKGAVTKIKD
jgi:cathepsin L